MVWGCITASGVGRLVRITGILNAAMLVDIYQDHLLGTLSDYSLNPEDIIFQQDNDPKHTSGKAWDFLSSNNIDMMPWPSSSPDLNIIEHVWHYLDKKIRSRKSKPGNLDELWKALEEEWYNIDIGYLKTLYDSMPRRVEAVYHSKGWNTKY